MELDVVKVCLLMSYHASPFILIRMYGIIQTPTSIFSCYREYGDIRRTHYLLSGLQSLSSLWQQQTRQVKESSKVSNGGQSLPPFI